MSKQQVYHLVKGNYEPYHCECGNNVFVVIKEFSEYGIGTVEMEFHCECGKKHYWTHGYAGKLEGESE